MVLDIWNLQFEGPNEERVNNAFEIALVNQNGYPFVATIRMTRQKMLNPCSRMV
jgi:hypothetical protein